MAKRWLQKRHRRWLKLQLLLVCNALRWEPAPKNVAGRRTDNAAGFQCAKRKDDRRFLEAAGRKAQVDTFPPLLQVCPTLQVPRRKCASPSRISAPALRREYQNAVRCRRALRMRADLVLNTAGSAVRQIRMTVPFGDMLKRAMYVSPR